MLTQKEQDFIAYWEQNRATYKYSWKQFLIALPLAVLICGGIYLAIDFGWYKRAAMVANAGGEGLPKSVFIAFIAIIFFIGYITRHFKWETNEQRYKELMAKKNRLNS